jgi:surface polysaccharide O-acyltransferase-like enzyme
MLSGALLLDPENNEQTVTFLRKRFKRIVIPLLFWSCLYFLWLALRGHPITTKFIIRRFLSEGPYYHLYFLYLILGLYIITPILKTYLRSASSKNLSYFLLICFSLGTLNGTFNFFNDSDNYSSFGLVRFIPFIGYYVAGFHLRHFTLPRNYRKGIMVVLVFCILTISLGSWFLIEKFGISSRGYYLHTYLCLPEIVMSVSIYLFVLAIYENKQIGEMADNDTIFYRLAPVSFGTYLLHPLVVSALGIIGLDGRYGTPLLGIPLTIAVTLISCYCIISVIRKLPLLKYTV